MATAKLMEIEPEDISTVSIIFCECGETATTGFSESLARHEFAECGWRRISNRVLCPECVADITKQEGVGG